jgi:hypothetical protein
MENPSLADIYKYPKVKAYEGLTGNFPIVDGNTLLGCEIELENFNTGKCKNPSTWKRVEDHSLKLNGMELVTIPIKFKYFEVELDRALRGLYSDIKMTSRCSIHIHLNIRDFTIDDIKKFLMLYMMYEKSLFNVSGKRWNNHYCIPLYSTTQVVRQFIQNGFAFSTFLPVYWYKYMALNLCPIFGGESSKIGTAEFRHMVGTLDKETILNWCNLIIALKIAAKKMKLEDVEKHLKTMLTTSGYAWFTKEVFGDFSTLITNQPSFVEDIESCITKTKYTFFGWINELPEAKKQFDIEDLYDDDIIIKEDELTSNLAHFAKYIINHNNKLPIEEWFTQEHYTPNEEPSSEDEPY